MKNEDNLNPVEQTVADMADYLQLRVDKFKLRLLDNLATFFNSVFSVIILIILASFAILFIASAITWALALLVGLLYAFLIMAALFIIATVIVYVYRRNLLADQIVRLLSKLMFEKDKFES